VGLNILKSLRAQFSLLIKRWLSPVYVASWIGLTFCGVLFIALWGLFRVTNLHNIQSVNKDQMGDAIHMALNFELEFNSQIGSWKNFLLRGEDSEMYDQYLREFERSDSKIQKGLKELLTLSHFLEFPTEDLRLLIEDHRVDGDRIRATVKSVNPADASSFIRADREAFDLGRLPGERFVQLVSSMKLYARGLEANSRTEMQAVTRQINVSSVVSVVFGIFLSAFFIIDRSKKEKVLWEAKTTAENANRAKDSFLANISHEIRTPMNAIVGLSEVLSDTTLTADQDEYVRTIRQSGSDLLGIINEILDLSILEGGQVGIKAMCFQLRDCVEAAADVIAPKAAKKGIDFSIQMDPDLPIYITADEMRVRQIIINLLGNAVKFTDHGRIELKLEGDYDDMDEYILSIHVSDTGGGIKKKDQEKLFRAFSQVDESNARRFGGTGLGLTISRDLSRMMGGDISVNSIYGEGTTFTVTIKPQSVSKEIIRSEDLDLSVIERKSIAIVDASDFNREEIVKFLKRWGAQVSSWETAAGFLENWSVDPCGIL
jgi:signal transduction histidine kinase